MLYTRKGDKGDTSIFGCDQRFSKSSDIAEALGSLDECNSFLGFCKLESRKKDISIKKISYQNIIDNIQQNLFIIQAEVAGADKKITKEKIQELEGLTDQIEKELPPINSFFISGGVELSSLLDFARTIARRAERRVVAVSLEKVVKVNSNTLVYMNRLSSLLYAMARFTNYKFGIKEESPTYK